MKFIAIDTEITLEFGFTIQIKYDSKLHEYIKDNFIQSTSTTVATCENESLSNITFYTHNSIMFLHFEINCKIQKHHREFVNTLFSNKHPYSSDIAFIGFNTNRYDDWILTYFINQAKDIKDVLEYSNFLIDGMKEVRKYLIARDGAVKTPFKDCYFNRTGFRNSVIKSMNLPSEYSKYLFLNLSVKKIIQCVDFRVINKNLPIRLGLKPLIMSVFGIKQDQIMNIKCLDKFREYASNDVEYLQRLVDSCKDSNAHMENTKHIIDLAKTKYGSTNPSFKSLSLACELPKSNYNKIAVGIFSKSGNYPCEYDVSKAGIGRLKIKSLNLLKTYIEKIESPNLKSIAEIFYKSRINNLSSNYVLSPDELFLLKEGVYGLPITDEKTTATNHSISGGMHDHDINKNNLYKSTEDTILIDIDYESQYPNIMKMLPLNELGFFKRDLFNSMISERIKEKKAGNKSLSTSLKLLINSIYGLFNSESFKCKCVGDIVTAFSNVLILLLVDIVTKKYPFSKVISINTDGVMFQCNKSILNEKDDLANTIQKLSNISCDFTEYNTLCKKDVNNYIARTTNNNIKYKGSGVGVPKTNIYKRICVAKSLPTLAFDAHTHFMGIPIVQDLHYLTQKDDSGINKTYSGYFTFKSLDYIDGKSIQNISIKSFGEVNISFVTIANVKLYFKVTDKLSDFDKKQYLEVVNAYIDVEIKGKNIFYGETREKYIDEKIFILENIKALGIPNRYLGISYTKNIKSIAVSIECIKENDKISYKQRILNRRWSHIQSNVFSKIFELDSTGGLILYPFGKFVIIDIDYPEKTPEGFIEFLDSQNTFKVVSNGDINSKRCKYIFKNTEKDTMYTLNKSCIDMGFEVLERQAIISSVKGASTKEGVKKHYVNNNMKPKVFSKTYKKYQSFFYKSDFIIDNVMRTNKSDLILGNEFLIDNTNKDKIILYSQSCISCNRFADESKTKYMYGFDRDTGCAFTHSLSSKCVLCKKKSLEILNNECFLSVIPEEEKVKLLRGFVEEDVINFKNNFVSVAPTGSGKTTSIMYHIIKHILHNEKVLFVTSSKKQMAEMYNSLMERFKEWEGMLKNHIVYLDSATTEKTLNDKLIIITHHHYLKELHECVVDNRLRFKYSLYEHVSRNTKHLNVYVDEFSNIVEGLSINKNAGLVVGKGELCFNSILDINKFGISSIRSCSDFENGVNLDEVIKKQLKQPIITGKSDKKYLNNKLSIITNVFELNHRDLNQNLFINNNERDIITTYYKKINPYYITRSIKYNDGFSSVTVGSFKNMNKLPSDVVVDIQKEVILEKIFMPVIKYTNQTLLDMVNPKRTYLINATPVEYKGMKNMHFKKKIFNYKGVVIINVVLKDDSYLSSVASKRWYPFYEFLHNNEISSCIFTSSKDSLNIMVKNLNDADTKIPMKAYMSIYGESGVALVNPHYDDDSYENDIAKYNIKTSYVRSSFSRGTNLRNTQLVFISTKVAVNHNVKLSVENDEYGDSQVNVKEDKSFFCDLLTQPIGRILRGKKDVTEEMVKVVVLLNNHDLDPRSLVLDEKIIEFNTIHMNNNNYREKMIEIEDIVNKYKFNK